MIRRQTFYDLTILPTTTSSLSSRHQHFTFAKILMQIANKDTRIWTKPVAPKCDVTIETLTVIWFPLVTYYTKMRSLVSHSQSFVNQQWTDITVQTTQQTYRVNIERSTVHWPSCCSSRHNDQTSRHAFSDWKDTMTSRTNTSEE